MPEHSHSGLHSTRRASPIFQQAGDRGTQAKASAQTDRCQTRSAAEATMKTVSLRLRETPRRSENNDSAQSFRRTWQTCNIYGALLPHTHHRNSDTRGFRCSRGLGLLCAGTPVSAGTFGHDVSDESKDRSTSGDREKRKVIGNERNRN